MKETFEELKQRIAFPELIAEKDPYRIKFAVRPEEILATQRLRYQVFNLEQGKGLQSANEIGVDKDEYDDYSLHLVVQHKDHSEPIGTYRIILSQQHPKELELYSDREFKICGLGNFLPYTLEVGRSCVSPAYRNGTVVALLWAGLAEVMARSKMRYLVGCVSLEDTRPESAWALYDYFVQEHLTAEDIQAIPRQDFVLPRPPRDRSDAILNDPAQIHAVFPPLLKGYLRMGGKICGFPAYDYEFGTSDFLIILDVARLPERYSRHFNVREVECCAK